MMMSYRMRPSVLNASVVLAIFVASAVSNGPSALAEVAQADRDLLESRFPGVRIAYGDEDEPAVYGRPMTVAAGGEKAVQAWLHHHAGVLGARVADLRIASHHALGGGALSVTVLQQTFDGVPVEGGIGRMVVSGGGRSRVVYAAGRFARRPTLGFPADRVEADAAIRTVRTNPVFSELTEWSPAQLVVFVPGDSFLRNDPVRAWKFHGSTPHGENFAAYTFFVDASNGNLIHVQDEVYQLDIFGHASGKTTPGLLPDLPTNAPVAVNLAELEVQRELSGSALTDAGGDFILSNAGTDPVDVFALLSGPWVFARDSSGEGLRVDQTVTPPGPADLFFNDTPAETTTSQVNAFLHTNATHNFYKQRQPAFTGLDLPLDCFVNMPSTCNAFFTPVGLSINFFASGSGCPNTAYSTVVAHEYGHFIVDRLNLPQGAFGEGFGDCTAILQHDDPVVGREFIGPGTSVRDIVTANKQYPCFGEVHDCGQVLGGVWWDLKLNLQASMGAPMGLDYARQLFTDWSQITIGGRLRNSAHPLTAVEVLTVDDDNADISNGTPHGEAICDAFAAHSISCPGTCDDVNRMRLTCRSGTFTLQATVVTQFSQGTELILTLDGGDPQIATVSRFGRASARWLKVSEGEHQACVQDCPGVCRSVSCEP